MKKYPTEVQNLDKIYKIENVKRYNSKKNEEKSQRRSKFVNNL